MSSLSAAELAGQRLLGVTVSLHEYDGVTSQSPVHAWLHLDRSGCVQCHAAGDGDVALTTAEPYAPYDMQEHGRVVVVHGQPQALAAHTSEVVRAVSVLDQHPPGMPVGVVLGFPSGSVAIANLWDELVVDVWPGTFEDLGVRTRKHGQRSVDETPATRDERRTSPSVPKADRIPVRSPRRPAR